MSQQGFKAGVSFNAHPVRSDPPALALLPRLHAEARTNLALSRFLAAGPATCVTLMSAAAMALLITSLSGGGTLKADFTWAALLLIGIVAMIRNHIRGFARSLRRVPLEEAASDQRMLLLYLGAAWGSGGFLVMPDLPVPPLVLAFALLPCLAVARIVTDSKAAALFILPATLSIAGAAWMGAWPQSGTVALAILILSAILLTLPALQHKRRAALPNLLAQ